MCDPVLQALLAWNRAECVRWGTWFAAHPEALALGLGAGAGGTVRQAIHHVFAVDLRYAQRLMGLPVAAFETIEADGCAELFALGVRAQDLLSAWLARATPAELAQDHTFMTLSAGERRASARKILLHATTHHVRHWAQLATILRQHGSRGDWAHDFLLSDAMR
jgi:uncharacterized damage-inducible protein DinB